MSYEQHIEKAKKAASDANAIGRQVKEMQAFHKETTSKKETMAKKMNPARGRLSANGLKRDYKSQKGTV